MSDNRGEIGEKYWKYFLIKTIYGQDMTLKWASVVALVQATCVYQKK